MHHLVGRGQITLLKRLADLSGRVGVLFNELLERSL
jgi:hypothetical protein